MHKVPVAISTLQKKPVTTKTKQNKAGTAFLELKRNKNTKPNRTEKHLQKHWKRKA